MPDTPRVPPQGNLSLSRTPPSLINTICIPLQANVRLSSIPPSVTNFPANSDIIIADGDDPIIVFDDEEIFESPFTEYKCVQFTRDTSLASGPQIITGVGFKPSLIMFQTGTIVGNPWGSLGQAQASDIGGEFCIEVGFFYNDIFSQPGTAGIQRTDAAGASYAFFNVQQFDDDGFTVGWSKVGSPTVSAVINAACFGLPRPSVSVDYTKLLLHFDGVDGSQTFVDSSSFNHPVIVVDNAQIDTAQSVFGGSSLLIDGISDHLRLDGSADFAFSSGDFTIDFRLRFNSLAISGIFYDSRPLAEPGGVYPVIYFSNADNKIRYFQNGDKIIASSAAVINQWYHVAVVRSSNSTKLYIDGVQSGSTYVDNNVYLNGANRPIIGAGGYDLSSSMNGWIDELRVSKGIARWTANFTPPTAPYVS